MSPPLPKLSLSLLALLRELLHLCVLSVPAAMGLNQGIQPALAIQAFSLRHLQLASAIKGVGLESLQCRARFIEIGFRLSDSCCGVGQGRRDPLL